MTSGTAGGDVPFAPSAAAARFASLGFHEAAADLFYVRMIGYFIGDDSTGHGVADLAEAVAALDPRFRRVYEHGANAMTLAKHDVDNAVYLRAIHLLELGIKQYPTEWKLPYLAGQIYTQDLVSDDPAQRRAWDERGVSLIEQAIRKPGAPASVAAWAAKMHTKLGAHQRAVDSLREMLLITQDVKARARLLQSLAALVERDAAAVEAEIHAERAKFEREWQAERSTVPATMYIIVGPRIAPGFDMSDLATGGIELFVAAEDVQLEPLE